MTYRDMDGKITIDEMEANKDIASMKTAISKLKDSKVALTQLANKANELEGKTATSINTKSLELIKVIDERITALESAIDYIQKVVAHYQRLDQEVKSIIQSRLGNAGGGGGSW
jgi:hypothetical protein